MSEREPNVPFLRPSDVIASYWLGSLSRADAEERLRSFGFMKTDIAFVLQRPMVTRVTAGLRRGFGDRPLPSFLSQTLPDNDYRTISLLATVARTDEEVGLGGEYDNLTGVVLPVDVTIKFDDRRKDGVFFPANQPAIVLINFSKIFVTNALGTGIIRLYAGRLAPTTELVL